MNYCDHGHETHQETRLLPLSGGASHGNIICCKAHYDHEIAFRRESGSWEKRDGFDPFAPWDSLKIYAASERV